MVDLGKWLGGEYKISGPPADDQDVAEEVRRRAVETPPANGDEESG